MRYYDFEVRVAYADTDRMGVVYYANYLVLFERGRTEFLRSLGLRYRDLEEREGIYLPAIESHIQYLAPAHYDDLIRVRTFMTDARGAHIHFRYEVTLVESRQLIATGLTKHVTVDRDWKPIRLPAELRRLLEPHLVSG
jgi:acyl-CoA thioester hydrolase